MVVLPPLLIVVPALLLPVSRLERIGSIPPGLLFGPTGARKGGWMRGVSEGMNERGNEWGKKRNARVDGG